MTHFDLLLKGGIVIDPASETNTTLDVAVSDGTVAVMRPTITECNAKEVVDVSGCLVVPGLIDLHTHVYWKGTSLGVDPEQLVRKTGVTTLVDAGSAGAGNFEGFRSFVIANATPDIFAFLNISFAGILANLNAIAEGRPGYVWGECEPELLDAEAAIKVAQVYPSLIRGIKVRVGYQIGDLDALRIAKTVASVIRRPIMVHISAPPPTISEVLPVLEKGDILTHAFRGFPNCLVDARGRLLTLAREARDRGVIFDIGHGYGSFSFETARLLLDQAFVPDVISTDVHVLSILSPACNLPTVLSKFLNLGMEVDNLIATATSAPAKAIGLADGGYGSLKTNGRADITVLRLERGQYEFKDSCGNTLAGDRRLEPVLTVLKGEICRSEAVRC